MFCKLVKWALAFVCAKNGFPLLKNANFTKTIFDYDVTNPVKTLIPGK